MLPPTTSRGVSTSVTVLFSKRVFEYRSGFCRTNAELCEAWSRMRRSSGRSILSSASGSTALACTSFFIRVVRPLKDLWAGWDLSRELSPRFGRILKLLSLLRWNPSGLSLLSPSQSGALSDTLSSSIVCGDEHGVKRRQGESGGGGVPRESGRCWVVKMGVARPPICCCCCCCADGRCVVRKAAARKDRCCLWSRLVMVKVDEDGS